MAKRQDTGRDPLRERNNFGNVIDRPFKNVTSSLDQMRDGGSISSLDNSVDSIGDVESSDFKENSVKEQKMTYDESVSSDLYDGDEVRASRPVCVYLVSNDSALSSLITKYSDKLSKNNPILDPVFKDMFTLPFYGCDEDKEYFATMSLRQVSIVNVATQNQTDDRGKTECKDMPTVIAEGIHTKMVQYKDGKQNQDPIFIVIFDVSSMIDFIPNVKAKYVSKKAKRGPDGKKGCHLTSEDLGKDNVFSKDYDSSQYKLLQTIEKETPGNIFFVGVNFKVGDAVFRDKDRTVDGGLVEQYVRQKYGVKNVVPFHFSRAVHRAALDYFLFPLPTY